MTKGLHSIPAWLRSRAQRGSEWPLTAAFSSRSGQLEPASIHFAPLPQLYDEGTGYSRLLKHRTAIEAQLGYALQWREQPEKKASLVLVERAGVFRDPLQAQEILEWLVARGDEFARVLMPSLERP